MPGHPFGLAGEGFRTDGVQLVPEAPLENPPFLEIRRGIDVQPVVLVGFGSPEKA